MPGLEVCLSCVLLFICLCVIKKKWLQLCEVCPDKRKKNTIQKKLLSLQKCDCMSVATMVAPTGFDISREPQKCDSLCLYDGMTPICLEITTTMTICFTCKRKKNSFMLRSGRCLNELLSFHWIMASAGPLHSANERTLVECMCVNVTL